MRFPVTRLLEFRMLLRIVACALLCAPFLVHAELYKYVNEDGVTVLDSHVPARYVKNGYTIISLDGRVLEVVARALTDDEIRDRDQRLAEQAERDRITREQKIADDNLLRLYGAPEDVTRARDTKLASIDGFINTSRSNLARVKAQKRNLEQSAADTERAGGAVSRQHLERIRSVENRIRQYEAEIQQKLDEAERLRQQFAKDLQRVRELRVL